jgi:mannose/cellobiose epimerase-like protein (N-acyl-D-glucosamine 2-epimerase family)
MTDQDRLGHQATALIDFARRSAHPMGFGWLSESGSFDLGRPVELWITCRMTHIFALESLRVPRLFEPTEAATGTVRRDFTTGDAEHGVRALLGPFHDDQCGGWFSSVTHSGPRDDAKTAYGHAFVVLAGASAAGAKIRGGRRLLAEALEVFDRHFWREDDDLVVDHWDRAWSDLEPYRGANANMHAVEALLAAYDVTGDRRRLDQACRITERMVHEFAAADDYGLCEHYDGAWGPMRDYHRDEPDHPFRPYGVTIGHLFEWARLALDVRTALGAEAPAWLLADAVGLFDRAVRHGWSVDRAPGFVYTTDFGGRAVVRQRLHWVVAEAIAAAWSLWAATGRPEYRRWYDDWWAYAERYLVDGSSWRHELDPANRPAATVWSGRPDTYHAYQATILPLVPAAASFVGALTAADAASH